MIGRFEDHRGVIQDLFDGEPVVVSRITTFKDAIRGNHVHERTRQWTHVTKGRLLIASCGMRIEVEAGQTVYHSPGDPHAWQALEDSECLVFTKGPRSGADYEKDTIRLDEALL